MKPNSPNPLHAVDNDSRVRELNAKPFQSPYLKAILSGAARALNPGQIIRMIDDKTAASRYIQQSSFLRG